MSFIWTTLAPVPAGAFDSGSLVNVGGSLYLSGQYSDSGYVYTTATDTWTPRSSVSSFSVSDVGAIAVGTVIYYVATVGGGLGFSGPGLASFDTATNTWTDYVDLGGGGDLNFFNTYHTSERAVAGKLYIYGTTNVVGLTRSAFLIYDIATEGVTFSSRSSHDTRYRSIVTDSTRIYAFEGYNGHWNDVGLDPSTQSDTGVMETYNPVSDLWQYSPNTDPQYRNDHVGVFFEGKVYVIGGGSDDNNFPDGYAVPWISSFDTSSETWTIEGDLDQPRGEPNVCLVGSTLYVCSGFGNANNPELSFVRTTLIPSSGISITDDPPALNVRFLPVM